MRDSFVMHKIYYEVIKELSKEDQLIVYNAINSYVFSGVVPELSGANNCFFILIKHYIDMGNNANIILNPKKNK